MQQTYKRPCPQCARDVTWPETATYPFCSERCRLIDLGMWASGDYRIPGEPVPDEADELGRSDLEGERDINWGEESY